MVRWPNNTHIWFGVYQEVVKFIAWYVRSSYTRLPPIWQARHDLKLLQLRKFAALGPDLQGTNLGSLELPVGIESWVGYNTQRIEMKNIDFSFKSTQYLLQI